MNKLTNVDIVNKLVEISKLQNCCDRQVALKQFKKEYKQTNFYHITHKNLDMLYYEVVVTQLLSFQSLLQNVQNFINNMDLSHWTQIMDQINESTADTIRQGLAAFDETDLSALFKKK